MNNFNKSDIGVNIELSASYDLDLSQIEFNENFIRLKSDGASLLNDRYFNVDRFLFTDYGNLSNDFSLDDVDQYDLKTGTVKDIKLWINDNFSEYIEDKNDLAFNYCDKPFNKLLKAELIECLQNELSENDFIEFLTSTFDPLYSVIAIRGYSQGDYAEIIVPSDHGYNDSFDFNSYFTNLFYDAPIYACMTIDDDLEFDFCEYIKDSYSYDKSELIEIAEKHLKHDKKSIIMEWLESNLPTELEYI